MKLDNIGEEVGLSLPRTGLKWNGLVVLDLERDLDVLRIGAHVEVRVLSTSTSTGIEVKDGEATEGSITLSFSEADVLEGRLLASRETDTEFIRLLVREANPAIKHLSVARDGVLRDVLGLKRVRKDGPSSSIVGD
jgi:hypothetical protein